MILAGASPVTLGLSLGAALAYGLAASGLLSKQNQLNRASAWVAWSLHALAIAWSLWGSTPRFGFAPALSVTAWLIGLVYAIEGYFYPQLQPPRFLATAGAVVVVLAWLFPGSALHPSSSPLLPLHWALGIASYGLFAVAVVHAWVLNRAEARVRSAANADGDLPLLTQERMVFRLVKVGFVLLTLTLVFGFFFESWLYGHKQAFKLDHKTIFSVLSWLTFAGLLLGRARFGWRGKRAIRVLYTGSGLLLLAYVGSRFVLEVVLQRAA
jgi:ABC-type uncharacterized transport system permease subunit